MVEFPDVAADTDCARLYVGVCLIDCDSAETLDDLLASSALERFVVRRLSDRSVVVDGQQKAQIARLLSRRGQPFRVVDLPSIAVEWLVDGAAS